MQNREWITDRLPTDNGYYLTTVFDEGIKKRAIIYISYHTILGWAYGFKVLAWKEEESPYMGSVTLQDIAAQ